MEKELKAGKPHFSAEKAIFSEMAQAYSSLGDSKRAAKLLETAEEHLAVHAWVASAVNLCAAKQETEAQRFLDHALSLVRSSASDKAMVAFGFEKCGNKERASELFIQAQDMTRKTSTFRIIHPQKFANAPQLSAVERNTETSEIELFERTWPADEAFSREIRTALKLAHSGNPSDGLQRLENAFKQHRQAITKPFRRETYPLDVPLLVEISTARAEILALLQKQDEAKEEFKEALRNARASESHNQRAQALVKVAQAQTRSGFCDLAAATLLEARISTDRTFMSNAPGGEQKAADFIAAMIAHGLARCGFVDRAHDTALAILATPRATEGRKYFSNRETERVLAQVAITYARKKDFPKALRELSVLSITPAKLEAAIQINTLAKNSPFSRKAEEFLMQQASFIDDYFQSVTNSRERRIVIGYFSHLVRESSPNADTLLQRLKTEATRIDSENWRARAFCELGYTAHVIGNNDRQRLFDEGVTLAKNSKHHAIPHNPPPSGACAYWLKLAGDQTTARLVADQPIEPLRQRNANKEWTGRIASSGALLGLAISYAEAESGEILVDWNRLVWE